MKDTEISLEKSKRAQLWLEQFEEQDQPYASLLLKKIQWVSSHEFEVKINALIDEICNKEEDKIALFVEREVLDDETVYSFNTEKPQRAFGNAFPPILSTIDKKIEIGSEGILNNIITRFQRLDSRKYYNYPSAEIMRSKRINKVIVLTDTIGSGNQLNKYLNCFWNTPSIKSWLSSGHINVYVVCFAATEFGLSRVELNKTKPSVFYSRICPTIDNSFTNQERKKIYEICNKYNPLKKHTKTISFLGYGGVSSLICYSHGLPNNAPLILYKRSATWRPFFRGRATNDVIAELPGSMPNIDEKEYLRVMGEKRLSASKKLATLDEEAKKTILLLAALNKSPRSNSAIASRSGLSSNEVCTMLAKLMYLEWVDSKRRITDEGRFLLSYLRKENNKLFSEKTLPASDKIYYYPKTLRGPS
ncbi:TPA: hypothetical protein MD887_004719 [Klebsiella oxytoca]|uniref:phosphoribosyltransferase-like protein n=1 Tax=Enterobacteriaceae TaxID=543 RepID=UPI00254FF869|nr:hypothetical protein [Klebsiella oxytoca]HBV8971073.1 hypothetical protein [Klebsiella oxytoca]HDU3772407.1 hypothetical protein [Klebsiella aerogenes]